MDETDDMSRETLDRVSRTVPEQESTPDAREPGVPDAPAAPPASAAAPAVGAGSTAAAPGRTSRLRALDGLRMIAALMVCLYHYAGRNGEISHSWGASPRELFPDLSAVASYGCLGVQVFFVISGFVICMSSWGRTLGDFFRSRVSRLYPAYWVAIVLVASAGYVLPSVSAPLHVNEILVNFTMLQQPTGVHRVLGVCWTLWTEARFYLLFAILVVRKGTTYRRVVAFCCLWTVATGFAQVAHNALVSEIVMQDSAPFFIGGLALYLIHRYGSDLLLWLLVAASFLLGQHYAVASVWAPHLTHVFYARSQEVVIGIVAFAFASVAAVALGWLRWADWRWLTFAGALTYPFYLVHEHLGWFMVDILTRKYHVEPRLTLVATVVAMLVLAWLMHRLVEKPLGPRLQRTMRQQSGRLRTLRV